MLLIKNVKIFTMAGDIIENGQVVVKDGKIKEVGQEVYFTGGEVIDGGGLSLYPGFIDAHSHLGLWEDSIGFEGSDGNEMTDPVTPEIRAIDGINPMDGYFKDAYEGGVTAVVTGPGSANVIGGMSAAIKTYGHRIDDMLIKSPIAMKIAFGENPKRVYNGQNKAPMTRMATASILRETLFKAQNYLEKKENAKDKSAYPEFNMKMEAMIPVMKKEIPLKAHAHRADDIFTAIRIAKEFDLDITLDHCTEGHLIAEDLAKEGKYAIVGPTFGDRSKFELKNKTFDTPRILHEAGVMFSITTDSPVTPLESLPLCAALAHRAGLDEMEALKAITINSAIIAGLDDRIGSIEVGKDADLVLIKGNPLKDVDYDVKLTMIDGRVVHRKDL